LVALRDAAAAGQLDSVQRLLFAETRAPEELYDLDADPWEVHNLAADPAHSKTLGELRSMLEQWIEQTQDQGRTPETESRYDADMAAYQGRKPNPEVAKNIALMKRWASEGK
jgi:arylsulfatase A-like enzyme